MPTSSARPAPSTAVRIEIKILPGISPFIGSTQAEADRLEDEFNELIQPEYSLTQLRQMIGVDLTGYDLDGPVPASPHRYRRAHAASPAASN